MSNIIIYNNLIKPLATSKSYRLIKQNRYCFISSKLLNKNTAKKILQLLFRVKINRICALTQVAKIKNFRGIEGARISKKKFYINIYN